MFSKLNMLQNPISICNYWIYNMQQLFIKTLTGETFTIEVETSDTIESVKQKIQDLNGVPACFLVLIFAGKYLPDHWTFRDIYVGLKSTIHCIYSFSLYRLFTLLFESSEFNINKQTKIELNASTLVEEMKYKIQDLTGIDVENIKLLADKHELDDKQCFFDAIYAPKWEINVEYVCKQ